jgi:hypothetical protein
MSREMMPPVAVPSTSSRGIFAYISTRFIADPTPPGGPSTIPPKLEVRRATIVNDWKRRRGDGEREREGVEA